MKELRKDPLTAGCLRWAGRGASLKIMLYAHGVRRKISGCRRAHSGAAGRLADGVLETKIEF